MKPPRSPARGAVPEAAARNPAQAPGGAAPAPETALPEAAPARPLGELLRSWKFWAVMGTLAALVALFTFGFTQDPKLVPSPLVGKAAPPFAVPQLNGPGRVELAELKGTPLILNFWASWCVACRDEAHVLQAAHLKYEQQEHRVRVVGIAIQDTPEKALAFAKRYGKTYFLALDNSKGEISMNYGLYGVPETFFIDAQGVVAFKQIGPVTPELIEAQVAKLAARAKGSS
jgi:cytochrome c biogenesis protein CcmG/thiol:disulfide interchange protein DsbE